MRSANSAHWVEQAIKKIGNQTQDVVITDMRFLSEYYQLKEAFGDKLRAVRINRFDSSPSTDPSERDLDSFDKYDIVINNKGTLQELFNEIETKICQSK
jgi:hypothetical protein